MIKLKEQASKLGANQLSKKLPLSPGNGIAIQIDTAIYRPKKDDSAPGIIFHPLQTSHHQGLTSPRHLSAMAGNAY